MADKFEGFEIEIREKISELDRTDDISSIFQGKIIRWQMSNGVENVGVADTFYKTDLTGEDEEGRLVFSGEYNTVTCMRKGPWMREPVSRPSIQAGVTGTIHLSSDEFGPGSKYKISITVRAKIVAPPMGMLYFLGDDCVTGPEFTNSCVISVLTNSKPLLTVASPPLPRKHPPKTFSEDVNLIAETEAIEFNSQFPGEEVSLSWRLTGQQISFDKVIISKKVFSI